MMKCLHNISIPLIAMALTAVILPYPAAYGSDAELPDEAAVRSAIHTILTDPFSAKAEEAQKVVLDFSQGSDKVKVVVSRGLGFYPGTRYSDMLLSHYISGVVRFGLDNPALAANELSGAESGLKAVLGVYAKIRATDPSFAVAELDDADVSMRKGQLRSFIASALDRAKQEMAAVR